MCENTSFALRRRTLAATFCHLQLFTTSSSDMDSFAFYTQLKRFLLKGEILDSSTYHGKVRRVFPNFIIKLCREFLWHLHADVCSQYLYILSINIHRGRSAIHSPVVVHSVDGEVLPRRVQQPTIVRDLHKAWYWGNDHRDLFRGEVTEPAFPQMNSEDQQNALRKAQGSEFPEAKDAFLFVFQSQCDMETFLSYCVDEQGQCHVPQSEIVVDK
ncbi:uncharacterized protein LOC127164251 isoform X1 [Labeo rohita]|uniref:uncharacterized protein LOC127164251 isoform X1 n=1 Tax=Labeo rohita TaxID=84645 RepID=UPI0021E2F0ED|nr:uncharacterized protein LOC127164251 isoform X1 [Labeo rohita]